VFQLPVQCASGDFQCFRHHREIAAPCLDRPDDRLPLRSLQTAQGGALRLDFSRSNLTSEFLRQVTKAHVALSGHKAEAFDEVSEFADVAGPGVMAKGLAGILVDEEG